MGLFIFHTPGIIMLFEYKTYVAKYYVYLYVTREGDVSVKINGRFAATGVPTRIGAVIIKKCRKAFFEWWQTTPTQKVECCAYTGDGKEEFRHKLFTRCGFEFDGGYIYTLTKPKPKKYTWRYRYYRKPFNYISISR